MKKILQPIKNVPGVRRVILISNDGVPIVSLCNRPERSEEEERSTWQDSADDINAFAGLAVGWLADVQRAVGPMSWNTPTRLVLHAARGTLVLLRSERVMLSVELERGVAPEELRLPMEAALSRLQRTLQRHSREDAEMRSKNSPEIPGIFPGQGAPAVDAGLPDRVAKEHVAVDSTVTANEEGRGASPMNESDPGLSTGQNDATGNEVP